MFIVGENLKEKFIYMFFKYYIMLYNIEIFGWDYNYFN